jgi:stage V sporulation protein S
VETLKVSARSSPNSVAGAMAGAVRHAGAVHVQVVGAGALNQAVKALAIARGFVHDSGIDLICAPAFADVLIDGEERTAIRLEIEGRNLDAPRAAAIDLPPVALAPAHP